MLSNIALDISSINMRSPREWWHDEWYSRYKCILRERARIDLLSDMAEILKERIHDSYYKVKF